MAKVQFLENQDLGEDFKPVVTPEPGSFLWSKNKQGKNTLYFCYTLDEGWVQVGSGAGLVIVDNIEEADPSKSTVIFNNYDNTMYTSDGENFHKVLIDADALTAGRNIEIGSDSDNNTINLVEVPSINEITNEIGNSYIRATGFSLELGNGHATGENAVSLAYNKEVFQSYNGTGAGGVNFTDKHDWIFTRGGTSPQLGDIIKFQVGEVVNYSVIDEIIWDEVQPDSYTVISRDGFSCSTGYGITLFTKAYQSIGGGGSLTAGSANATINLNNPSMVIELTDWVVDMTSMRRYSIVGIYGTSNPYNIILDRLAEFTGNNSLTLYRLGSTPIGGATGPFAFNEGYKTTASGGYSHAEGRSTTASGYCSHAEGVGTTVGGDCSHAEGSSTTASGLSSHAEGSSTTASGDYSHAEGRSTTASGYCSHAEGVGTTVGGDCSHAEGSSTTASGLSSHAEGSSTTASRASSHAEGRSTTASGQSSHAEGRETTASGDSSHAEGLQTTAKHRSQHAFGEYNIADPSLNNASNRGTYIEIVGKGTDENTRSNARTLDWSGNETLAGNLTIGGTITSKGQQILPQKQTDWNQTTSTESDYIKNKPAIKAGQGENSIIEGDDTTASGDSSHAEGSYTTARGDYSHAEGGYTTASGDMSHAEGQATTASGYMSHAEGTDTTASGAASHAEGYGATASGNNSHAEGGGTTASGYRSHAEGQETTATHRSQHVFGEYNIADPSTNQATARGTYIEIVGNGASGARSNARTLDWQGNEVLAGTITANGVNLNDELNLKQDALGFTPENVANKKTSLSENSDTYYPTQKAVKTAVDAKADDTKVAAIQGLIPTLASPTNQLADKDFVNSSIGTSTAMFRGTFTSVDNLPTTGVDNNDYAFVKIFDPIQTAEVLRYDRYKWSDGWSFEYSLNNSSFTAAQWDAINSNATASIISDLLSHASNISNPHAVTKSQVGLGDVDNTSDLNKPLSTAAVAEFATKQDALGFTPENVANKKTTLDDNSDTYYPTQKAVKTAVDAKVTGASSSVANEVPVYDGTTGKVLKSGSGVSAVGGNLTVGGTITVNGQQILPQKQTDWNQTTSTESDYIKNKPAIKAGQGVSSIIEGDGTTASGQHSHAEGFWTKASGENSHAEGAGTKASGNYSHAEGQNITASGSASHAEGSSTAATGDYSHTEGSGTKANNKCQHVFGEFNELDPSSALSSARGTYIEIVGNGATSSARSNARTLDWSGNEVLAGKITANGVNLNDALNLKQDALGFTPENVANKKTSLSENSDTYYPTQKAVKTAVDAKVEGPNSSVANTLPAFADETGRLLKGDTGVSIVNSEIIAGGVNINSAIAGIPTQISNALTLLDGELAFIFRES